MAPDQAGAMRVGFRAACACALFSLAYIVAQGFEWLGAFGSAGGPYSRSTPLGLGLLLIPSLLLGIAFMILAAALHESAPAQRRVFSQIALAFAIAYGTLIGLVYFVQLTLVAPRLASGDLAGIEPFLFVPYRSFLFAVDLLGYSFMSLSTLSGAFGLPDGRGMSAAKAAMIANGLLVPFLAFQMYWPALIAVASLWAVTFPAAMILLALGFHRIARAV